MTKNKLNLIFILIIGTLFLVSHPGEAQFWKRKKEKNTRTIKSKDLKTQSEFYFIEGMRYFVLEDYDKAKTNFEKVLDIDPNLAAAHYKIADLYLIQGQADKAMPFAKKALELDSKNKAYYLILARIYEFQQDYQRAALTLKELIENVEGGEEHYFDLALIQTYLEDYEGALETYDKVLEYFGPSSDVMQQKQRLLLRLNRLDEAVKVGQNMISSFPEEKELVYDQIRLLIANDREKEARTILNEKLEESPNSPEALILLSDLYRSEGKIDSANVQLNKAFQSPGINLESKMAIVTNLMRYSFGEDEQKSLLRLTEIINEMHPEESRAKTFQADVLLNFQKKEEALDTYKKVIQMDQSSLMVWTNIVLLHFEFGDYDSVTYYSKQALEYFPNQGRLWFMNGLGYYSLNDYQNAVKGLEQAEKFELENQTMRSDILSTLGDTYNSLEQFEKSDEAYEAALEINPDNEHVLNNYSYFLSLRNENLEKAQAMCEILMTISPDNSTYQDTYAWVLYKLGDYKKALTLIEKAIKDTNSGVVMEHHGDILYKLGRREEALESWKKAAEFEDASDLIDKKINDKVLYE